MELVEKLAAIEEIKQLRARYWRLVDAKQFDELEELFAPDAWFDSAEALFDPVKGQMPDMDPAPVWKTSKGIAENVKAGLPPTLQSAHMGHTPEVEITSETRAKAIHPFNDRLVMDGVLAYNGYGYYYDTYEKIDGKWKIKTSTIKRLRVVFDE